MQASCVDKILERIHSVIKSDKKNLKQRMTVKRYPHQKGDIVKADDLSHRYPVMMSAAQLAADDETLQQDHKAIEEELIKLKPRDQVLLPLMKSTFATRCQK